MTKTNLYALDFPALKALLSSWGSSPAHTRPLWAWLYRQWPRDFDTLPELPDDLRARLLAETTFFIPRVLARQEAPDGATRKDLLALQDDAQVEVVLLRYRQRRTACISTQVGCACGCRFCATGQMGFVRQLSSDEIIMQVLHFQRELAQQDQKLTNIVVMGMGEPLLNYEHTLHAIRCLVHPWGLGFVQRRITLSTAGIVPSIRRLADEPALQIRLAVSLHAATDQLRERLMPINRQYPLDALFDAIRYYVERTQRRVLLEWVMIDGVNDTQAQVQALIARAADLPVHVNLIRLNATSDYEGRPSSPEAMDTFAANLDHANIPHTVRQRRGGTIAAGCGQLRRQTLQQ